MLSIKPTAFLVRRTDKFHDSPTAPEFPPGVRPACRCQLQGMIVGGAGWSYRLQSFQLIATGRQAN